MNFAWSFKPIFLWLFAIVGIDLDESKRKSRCAIYLSIFICLFWALGLKIPYHTCMIYYELMSNVVDETSFVSQTNLIVILILGGVSHISIQIALIGSYFGKWKSFWEKLQLLQDAIGDEGSFYRQLRRETIKGLVLIFLVYQPCFYY